MNHNTPDPHKVRPSEGRYANTFKVGHNAFEFLLDFGQFFPESQQEWFYVRIITSPTYAKALLEILQQSVTEYEATYGPIRAPEK
jgi:hypothetical protein